VLTGGGPEEQALRERLGDDATFLGWQYGSDLARTYASADVFMFASRTDTFGQVLLEAQASGLPLVAVAEGGPPATLTTARPVCSCRPILTPWRMRSNRSSITRYLRSVCGEPLCNR
jgi:glycosyltransferase involved in cell wall biosynthesis